MTAISFIGLGAMGSRMAARLLAAGHDLTVYNRTAAKAQPLLDRGAQLAKTPAEAASQGEACFTMLSHPTALREVTEGPDGVVHGIAADATVIEMSTVGPHAVHRLRDVLPAGTGLLDAPVLGSIGEAEAGTLSVFVGGPDEQARRWTPLLELLGTPLPVGPLGSGAAAKLVANTSLFGILGVLGECLALARGLGLPQDTAFEVLARSPLAAQAERRRPAVESGAYPRRFPLALALKDAGLVAEAADAADVDLRLARATESWLAKAAVEGLADADYSALLAAIAGTPWSPQGS